MTLLAIDTATPQVSVALRRPDGAITATTASPGRRHAEVLSPMIDRLCRQAGLTMGDLQAVAVDVGPGLFTGLRVGLATAKALTFALGMPGVPVTSLEALAWPYRDDPRLVVAVVDARRHEVFRSVVRNGPQGPSSVLEPAVVGPDVLAAELAALGEDLLVVGDGALRYADHLEAAGIDAPDPDRPAFPHAAAVAELAWERLHAGGATGPDELRPQYLRPADVNIGWVQRDQTGAGT